MSILGLLLFTTGPQHSACIRLPYEAKRNIYFTQRFVYQFSQIQSIKGKAYVYRSLINNYRLIQVIVVIQITNVSLFSAAKPFNVSKKLTKFSTWNEIVGPPRRISIGLGERIASLVSLTREWAPQTNK